MRERLRAFKPMPPSRFFEEKAQTQAFIAAPPLVTQQPPSPPAAPPPAPPPQPAAPPQPVAPPTALPAKAPTPPPPTNIYYPAESGYQALPRCPPDHRAVPSPNDYPKPGSKICVKNGVPICVNVPTANTFQGWVCVSKCKDGYHPAVNALDWPTPGALMCVPH